MHDPSVLVYEIPGLRLDVWHNEPGGQDAGTVCGYPPRGAARLAWTGRHLRHLHYYSHPKWGEHR